MKRHNHYESAFENYLRSEMIPYVAVNEQRRSIAKKGSLKNLDFIVSPDEKFEADDPYGLFEFSETKPRQTDKRWLIDIKGRRFPSGSQYWRNWTTRDEIESLRKWKNHFGDGFDAALVFAYQLTANHSPVPPDQIHFFRNEAYGMIAISLEAYARNAKILSPKWGTISVPTPLFRSLARPLTSLFLDSVSPSNV